jgi:hypothetical protein
VLPTHKTYAKHRIDNPTARKNTQIPSVQIVQRKLQFAPLNICFFSLAFAPHISSTETRDAQKHNELYLSQNVH